MSTNQEVYNQLMIILREIDKNYNYAKYLYVEIDKLILALPDSEEKVKAHKIVSKVVEEIESAKKENISSDILISMAKNSIKNTLPELIILFEKKREMDI